ncbi:uncharacterized protein LOC115972642 [Quercus lobata]|uniref:uncharacterized protein LOC115972642 n=1 Tax=Quercus lobata TaxID=97700 RepID=UPI001243E2D1|nr:uncharacterized protein LOC115972642 [Quercus lobata]
MFEYYQLATIEAGLEAISDLPTQVRLINQSGTKICDFVKCLPTAQVYLAHNSFHNKVLFDELHGSLNVTSIYSLVDKDELTQSKFQKHELFSGVQLTCNSLW